MGMTSEIDFDQIFVGLKSRNTLYVVTKFPKKLNFKFRKFIKNRKAKINLKVIHKMFFHF